MAITLLRAQIWIISSDTAPMDSKSQINSSCSSCERFDLHLGRCSPLGVISSLDQQDLKSGILARTGDCSKLESRHDGSLLCGEKYRCEEFRQIECIGYTVIERRSTLSGRDDLGWCRVDCGR